MTTPRKTKRRQSLAASAAAASKRIRHIAAPTGEAKVPSDRDDTTLSAALERDVDSTDATQVATIFEEPFHVDDDAIIADADSTRSRRR